MKKDFNMVTEKIREALLNEFDELKTKKEKEQLSDIDFSFYLARDRKAALILKTLQLDIQKDILTIRKGISISPKQIDNK